MGPYRRTDAVSDGACVVRARVGQDHHDPTAEAADEIVAADRRADHLHQLFVQRVDVIGRPSLGVRPSLAGVSVHLCHEHGNRTGADPANTASGLRHGPSGGGVELVGVQVQVRHSVPTGRMGGVGVHNRRKGDEPRKIFLYRKLERLRGMAGMVNEAGRRRLPSGYPGPRSPMRHLVVFTSALIASASSAQSARSQTPATPAAAASARGATTAGTSAVAMQGELLPDEQIQQVLNRLTFGPRPGDAEKVRAMGIDKWIDLQLNPERIPDPAGDDVIRNYSVFSTPTGDIVRQFEDLQRLQRQAKAAGANDSMMTSPRRGRRCSPGTRSSRRPRNGISRWSARSSRRSSRAPYRASGSSTR